MTHSSLDQVKRIVNDFRQADDSTSEMRPSRMAKRSRWRGRLTGCYVTVPTQFHDGDLTLNLPAIRRNVEFLLVGAIREGRDFLRAGGAARDFFTMTPAERLRVRR